jgi:ubiquinone/menaquinone biosynthesis C-methylase UbiE
MTSFDTYFKTRLRHDPKRGAVWKEICRYLQRRWIPPGGAVLELGAGYGDFINNVDAAKKDAIDLSDHLATYLAHDVTFHRRSCTDLSVFSAASFDTVFASNLFEHLDRDQLAQTLAEVLRVLKPGARLILIQPNFKYCAPHYFDDYTHVQIFSHVSLADRLEAAAFQIEAVQPRFLPFSMKSRLPKAGLLVRAYLQSPIRPMAAQMLVVARKTTETH